MKKLLWNFFRRGAHGIVSREVEPELFVESWRKVSKASPGWIAAGSMGSGSIPVRKERGPLHRRAKVQLTPKESLIVFLRGPRHEEQRRLRGASWYHRTS